MFEEIDDNLSYVSTRPSLGLFPDVTFIKYLERLMTNIPTYGHKVFLTSSGSESTEVAIKLAMNR